MALASKPAVSAREYELVTALAKAGASTKKSVLKRGELSIHPPAIYQSLRTKGVLATETEGHGRGAKTMVRLLLEPDQLEFSKRGAKPHAAGATSAGSNRKPTVEEMLALCELVAREERLAAAAAAPEPSLLRELDSIKAAFTAAIAANDVARMVDLGKKVADVQRELQREAGSFDARVKAFERIERNPEHSSLAPFLRYVSPKRG